MLGELRQERGHIEEAILVMERLALGQGKRRGPAARLDDRGERCDQATWTAARQQKQTQTRGSRLK